MATKKTMTIAVVDGSIAIQYTYNGVAKQFEYYPICSVKGIVSTPAEDIALRSSTTNQRRSDYHHNSVFEIGLYLEGPKNILRFDIQDVTNQAGWVATEAGLAQAVSDINTWISECGCCDESEAILEEINDQFTGDVTITTEDISGDPAFNVAASTYTALELTVEVGTVTRGDRIYSVGVYSMTAPLNKTLPALTFDASAATAYMDLMS